MKHIKKYLLAVFAMILLLSLCACNTLPTDTTGGDGGNSSDPIAALKNFDQGSKIYVKVDEGNAWYVDYAVLSNFDGDKVSEICAGAMSYAELDLNKYSITVDGKAATADTIVKAGGKLILTNKTPAKVELKDGEFQVAFELYEPNSGREQGMYFACTPNTALKNFFEANITEGRQTYDDFAKDYDMYVNGKKTDGGTVLTADAYIFGYYTKKIDSGNNGGTEDGTITVKFDCTYADGKVESNAVNVIAKDGKITLDDFIKQYTRLDSFADSALRGTWTLNETVVIGGNVEISDGSALTYIQRIEVSKSIVTLRVVYSDGWDEEQIEVEGKSLTLRDFVEKYADPGCTFEESLETVHWTYYGKDAVASTVIEAGTAVFAIRNDAEVAEPEEGEVKIGIVVVDYESGRKQGLDLIVPEGEYTLKNFFETYVSEGDSNFEETLEQFDWYVDGQPATAETKITEKSELLAVMKEANEPAPPTPVAPIKVMINMGGLASVTDVNVPVGSIALEEFYSLYIIKGSLLEGKTFEATMQNGTWTVNGTRADATTQIKNGDEIRYTADQTGSSGSGNVTVTFTVQTPYGSQSQKLEVTAPITLRALFEKYLSGGDSVTFEETLADGYWMIGGEKVTGGEIHLADGIEVTYVVGNTGNVETVNVTVVYTYRDENGNLQEDKTEIQISENTNFRVFVDIYSDVYYDESLAFRTWYVNGNHVSEHYILKDGDIVTYDEISYITVYYMTFVGNTWTQLSYIVPGVTEITLGEFFATILSNGGDIEDTYEEYDWFVDDAKATASTVITDYSTVKVVECAVPPVEPGEDEFAFNITFYQNDYGISYGATLIASKETMELNALYELYCKMNGSSEYDFETFEWYVDGESAEHDTVVTAGQYVEAVLKQNGGDIDPPTEGFSIGLQYITASGYTSYSVLQIPGYTELSLGDVFKLYLSDQYGNFDNYEWSVDGKTVEMSFILREGMTLTIREKSDDIDPVEKFSVLVTLTDYTGTTYFETEFYIEGTCIALYDFYVTYLRDDLGFAFDDFGWEVNGYQVTDGKEALLIKGDQIVMTYPGIWGAPVTKQFEVLFTYIDANGDEFTNRYEISGYADLEIGKFFKQYLSMSYGGNASDYTWTVDGKTVDVDFILTDKVIVTMTEKNGTLTPPVQIITVHVQLTDLTGEVHFESNYYFESTSVSLYELYKLYLSDPFGYSFHDFQWTVNGSDAEDAGEAILMSGDKIVAVYNGTWNNVPSENSFTVNFTYIDADGNKITDPYTAYGYTELEIVKFFDASLSNLFFGTAKDYEWTVDGKVVDIYFILSDGMDVIMRDLGTAEKPEGISVQVEFTDFSGDIIVKEVIAIGYTDSIDLYTLYKEFIQNTVGDYAFEEFLWGINGMESNEKDIVRDGDYIVMVPRVLLPDPPVVEEIEVTVVVTENGEASPVTMAVPAGSTIADVLLELLESDAETLEAYFLFDINDKLVDINTVLNNGDVLTLTSRFEAPPAEGEITVYFQETLEGGEKVPYIISANSTLYDCLVLLGIPEDYLKTAEFYINGHLAGINTVLYEGDVIYISEKGTAPADVIVIHVSIYSDNTLMNQIPVEVVGYTEISISTFLKEYIEYLELYDGTFQCLVNGVEVNDPDYMLYNGDKVSFYKTSVDIPVDPPVDQGFTVYVSVMSGAGLDGMTYSYWVEVAPISIEDLYWKYMQQDGIFAEISLDVCEWMVNKEPADRYTQLNGMCDLQLIIHTESACEHNWGNADGYCSNCGEPCPEYDAHFDAYLFTSCPTCGYSTNGGAMQQTIVYVLQNGMEMSYVFTTMPGTYPTIDDVLMQAFGQNLDLMRDKGAVIWHDGIEITDKFYQVTGGRIEVTTQEIVEPPIDDPMQEYPIYFSRYYYTAMGTDEEGNEILGEWWNNDKSGEWWMWGGEYSLRDILYSVGLDFSDTDAVFVNGERVYDLGSTFTLDDTCYIVCLDERIPFDGLTVTVYNEVNGEERTYKYEAPMFYAQIRDQIFAGLDMGSLDFNYEAFLNGAVVDVWGLNEYRPLVLDCRFTLRERVTTVNVEVVDVYGGVANRYFDVVGAMPTVADFVNQHIGSFDAYRVFDIGGGTLRELFAEDQMRECYVVILPKELIKDRITVTYDLTFANDMGRYQGSFTLASPVLLATAFEQLENAEFNANDIWWNAYRYDICVNGVTLTDDKGAHYTLLWQDVTITACPVYTFHLALENMGGMPTFDPVKVNDPNTTFSELFKMFGIDNTDLFLFEYPMTDTVGMHFEYGDHSLYIRPKTVDIEFAIVDLHGNRLDARIEVPAPISVEQLISYMKNNGYYFEGELADFRCTVTDYASSEKFDVLDGSYVFKYSEDGYYGLYLECKQMFVNVEVMDANGMWITSHYSVTVEREWTLVQIAESVGCSVDDILRYATNYSGDVSAQERMAPNETLYIYTNSFTLYVTLYGTPDGDAYHTIENMRGGQMTVGNVLASLGYDWSMVATATLEGHDFGSMQVYADTVIESGSHLYFYFAEKQEFTVYINVFNGYGEVTYSNQLWFTEPISMADLLAQCGYSWDQVSYGYNFAGDITMDTVISQEDKIDIYLIANSEMQSFSVNVVFFNYQGEETDRYTFDSMAEPITVGNLLANCGYSWDVVESGYSQSFASSVTVDSVINQNDTIEIKLLPREAPIFITVFNSALEIVYESEIYVPENIVYYAPNLIKEIGFSWDQVDYGYYSGGTLTENSIIGADDKVEIYLVAETVDVVA